MHPLRYDPAFSFICYNRLHIALPLSGTLVGDAKQCSGMEMNGVHLFWSDWLECILTFAWLCSWIYCKPSIYLQPYSQWFPAFCSARDATGCISSPKHERKQYMLMVWGRLVLITKATVGLCRLWPIVYNNVCPTNSFIPRGVLV